MGDSTKISQCPFATVQPLLKGTNFGGAYGWVYRGKRLQPGDLGVVLLLPVL